MPHFVAPATPGGAGAEERGRAPVPDEHRRAFVERHRARHVERGVEELVDHGLGEDDRPRAASTRAPGGEPAERAERRRGPNVDVEATPAARVRRAVRLVASK
jgi:hypothetical protein